MERQKGADPLHCPWIDSEPFGNDAMMGVFAEFERSIIQERVRAGLKRARSEGKRLGRPPAHGRQR